MWAKCCEFLWAAVRFLAPERAAYETIIARYRQAMTDQKKDCEEREKELRADVAALKGSETRCRKELSEARHDIAELQGQVWELSAVVDTIDAIKQMREDPAFKRNTAEQIRMLRKQEPPGEHPPG